MWAATYHEYPVTVLYLVCVLSRLKNCRKKSCLKRMVTCHTIQNNCKRPNPMERLY